MCVDAHSLTVLSFQRSEFFFFFFSKGDPVNCRASLRFVLFFFFFFLRFLGATRCTTTQLTFSVSFMWSITLSNVIKTTTREKKKKESLLIVCFFLEGGRGRRGFFFLAPLGGGSGFWLGGGWGGGRGGGGGGGGPVAFCLSPLFLFLLVFHTLDVKSAHDRFHEFFFPPPRLPSPRLFSFFFFVCLFPPRCPFTCSG